MAAWPARRRPLSCAVTNAPRVQAYRARCKELGQAPDAALAALMSFLTAYLDAAAHARSAARRRPLRLAAVGVACAVGLLGRAAASARRQ
jgi:hypothetical protein